MVICCSLALGVTQTSRSDDELRERLVSGLEALAEDAASLRTTIRISTLSPLSIEWDDIEPQKLAEAPALGDYEEKVTWTRHDGRLRVDMRLAGDPRQIVLVWDGQEWFERAGSDLSIYPSPRELHHQFLPVFNGGIEWSSFLDLVAPSVLAEKCTLLEVAPVDSEVLFRFATSSDLTTAARVEMCVGSWSPFRIDWLALELIGPPGSEYAGEPVLRRQLVFLSWSDVGEITLPDSALFIEANWTRGDDRIGVRRLERVSASTLQSEPTTDALFDTTELFEPNVRIIDRSNDLYYTFGSTMVFSGDNHLSTHAPIERRITASEFQELSGPSNESGTVNE